MKIDLDIKLKKFLLNSLKNGYIETDTDEMKRLQALTPFVIEHVTARDELERLEMVRGQFKEIPAECDVCKFRIFRDPKAKSNTNNNGGDNLDALLNELTNEI